MSEQYSIECRVCEVDVFLTVVGQDYQCPTCGTMYEAEDGVLDNDLAADMYKLYKGAKLAGLIEDKEIREDFYHG